MDKIHIRDLALRCIIGVNDDERREKQDVVINITMHTDISKAAATDDFSQTVDYKKVKLQLVSLVEGSKSAGGTGAGDSGCLPRVSPGAAG